MLNSSISSSERRKSRIDAKLATGARFALLAVMFLAHFAVLYTIGFNHYYGPRKSRLKEVLADRDSLNVLVIGNSHAACIQPEVAGWRGCNLNQGGADLFEIAYQLKTLARRLPNLRLVIVSVSYFSFLYDNAAYVDGNGVRSRAERRSRLYAVYPGIHFIKGDCKWFLLGKLHPIVTEDHWERILWPDSERSVKKVQTFPGTPEEMARHGKSAARATSAIVLNVCRQHVGVADDAYTAILNALQTVKKEVRTVFVTPPFYRTYNECFDSGCKRLMKNMMQALTSQAGVEYYDFSGHPEFCDSASLFRNSDHLNELGAGLFTEHLVRAMEQRRRVSHNTVF